MEQRQLGVADEGDEKVGPLEIQEVRGDLRDRVGQVGEKIRPKGDTIYHLMCNLNQ
jgi:hypothetical protein